MPIKDKEFQEVLKDIRGTHDKSKGNQGELVKK